MAADPQRAMRVSVVMPARDAEGTIREALESLRAQTTDDWEVVVVADGSTDGTRAVVEELAARDRRIRVIDGPETGPAAARNAGIAAARFDWLAFLDADDRWEPEYLEALTGVLRADPELDAAHCGWARVGADGARDADESCAATGDLFPVLARWCALTIHSCVVRRARVLQAGGFDAAYPHAEDWDLWQRVARTGARFGRVPRTLALYRLSPGSVSLGSERMLASSLRVLDNASGPDPRVADPSPAGRAGLPIEPARRGIFAVWCAGAELALGRDARPLLDQLPGPGVELDPLDVAEALRRAVPYGSGRIPRDWIAIWPEVEAGLGAFLAALEEWTGTPLLARRARLALERAALAGAAGPRPATLGSTHGVAVDAAAPIPDVRPPAGVERVQVAVAVEGEPLGTVELPVCDGVVPGEVIADAIAAQHAWELLGRFLARSAYPALGHPAEAHDEVGWTVMLQELWGRPGWDGGRFYDPAAHEGAARERRRAPDGLVAIEVAGELPDVEVGGAGLRALVAVGGAALGLVEVPATGRVVAAQAIRAAVTTAGGFELCRLAVREGVVGMPLEDGGSLRERLARAAARARPAAGDSELLLGRRDPATIGSSQSRRTALPAGAAEALVAAAAVAGEPAEARASPTRARYEPDLIDPSRAPAPAPHPETDETGDAARSEAAGRNRDHFETLFASGADPWRYTHPYERLKYEQTLEMLPSGPIRSALELACAEGHFTAELATRVERLTAADISEVALRRAQERAAGRGDVRFVQLDLETDPLPGRVDLIVCSEVLYYLSGIASLRALAARIADALEPGGHLVTAHANLIVDDPDRPGFAWPAPFGAKVIGETMVAAGGLRLERELRTPLYRVQRFVRDGGRRRLRAPGPPTVIEIAEQPELPPPEVQASIRWSGGEAERTTALQPVSTDRLPILMYHRVAPEGPDATTRYRVHPDDLERQLAYLRAAGYRSVSLARWEEALLLRRPLPGRAVCLTFDDGFADFAEHAWPLLRRHGLGATLFPVAGAAGGTDVWNRRLGQEVPLLDWEQIGALAAEGVEIGSHTLSHPPLTGLAPAEVATELARSRAILEERLGRRITAIAYPYGDADPPVRHLAGAAGYRIGTGIRPGRSNLREDPLDLSRIEVDGRLGFAEFVASLSA